MKPAECTTELEQHHEQERPDAVRPDGSGRDPPACNAENPDYSFGTCKVGVLGVFTSAVVLLVIALFMGFESVQRILSPVSIQFNAAIGVAIVGLMVNIVSAFILQGGEHDHEGISE